MHSKQDPFLRLLEKWFVTTFLFLFASVLYTICWWVVASLLTRFWNTVCSTLRALPSFLPSFFPTFLPSFILKEGKEGRKECPQHKCSILYYILYLYYNIIIVILCLYYILYYIHSINEYSITFRGVKFFESGSYIYTLYTSRVLYWYGRSRRCPRCWRLLVAAVRTIYVYIMYIWIFIYDIRIYKIYKIYKKYEIYKYTK